MIRQPIRLSVYLSLQFLINVGIIIAVLMGIIILFEGLEIARRASSREIPIGAIIEMIIMKVPSTVIKIIPFAIFIGSILSLTKMTKTLELIVARASGISAWQFLLPLVIVSFLIGVFITTIFNPLSSIMLTRFEQLEARHFKGNTSMLSVSSTGLWFREDLEEENGKKVLHALRVSQEKMRLYDVTVYFFDNENNFIKRVDAKTAKLKEGYWWLSDAAITAPGMIKETKKRMVLNTQLKIQQIQDSFASPETISFWELPSFIDTLKEAGFSAMRHRMHWHSVIALPFFLASMVFMSAVFSLQPPRQGRVGVVMVSGLLTGLLIYFLPQLVAAYGLSGVIPIPFAAWAPVLIIFFLGTMLTLHFEDG